MVWYEHFERMRTSWSRSQISRRMASLPLGSPSAKICTTLFRFSCFMFQFFFSFLSSIVSSFIFLFNFLCPPFRLSALINVLVSPSSPVGSLLPVRMAACPSTRTIGLHRKNPQSITDLYIGLYSEPIAYI